MLPGALVAVVAGIVLNEIFKMTGSSLAIQTQHLVSLPVPQSLDDFKTLLLLLISMAL